MIVSYARPLWLGTLTRAAHAVGRKLRLEVV